MQENGSHLRAADARWLLLGLGEQKCHEMSRSCQVSAVWKRHLSNPAAARGAARRGLLGAAHPAVQPTSSPPRRSLEKASPLPQPALGFWGCISRIWYFILHTIIVSIWFLILTYRASMVWVVAVDSLLMHAVIYSTVG